VATGEELRRIVLPHGIPYTLQALSRDEKQLAAVMLDGRAIQLIDLDNGKAREGSPGHPGPVDLALLAPNGRTAITGHFPCSALIWDAAKGTVRHFDNQGLLIFGLTLAGDSRTLFGYSTDNNIRVWDMESGKQRRVMKMSAGSLAAPEGFRASRDGKIIAFVDRQLFNARTIRVLDGETGKERKHFRAPDSIYDLSLSDDGRWLVGWSLERRVHVWDLAAGVKRHEYALSPDPPGGMRIRYRAAASPDGRLFAVCTEKTWTARNVRSDNWLIVKDLAAGRDVHSIRNPPSDYGVLAFSPDGRTLAYSGTYDATIRFLEVASGKERRRLAGLQGKATALSFSASGARLLSGCADTTALIWDLGLRPAPRPATAEELTKLWADLADADAARAYRAIRKLASSPSSAILFMRKHLSAAAAVDAKRLARLIADLDSDDFAIRQKSTEEMEKLGQQAAPFFRKALDGKPSLEVRRRLENLLDQAQRAWWDVSGERLRSLRAIEALELAGTKQAQELLKTLATGAEGARLTEESRAALKREAIREGNGSP
jgi:WD40 repeat protein